MRVLVCGDRNWSDFKFLSRTLFKLHKEHDFECVIEGEANGADKMVRKWAKRNGIKVEKYSAKWKEFGKAAGPIRNIKMLKEGQPDLVVAFHNNIKKSKGTAHMLSISREAGIKTELYSNKKESTS